MANPQLLNGSGLDAVIGMYPVVHRLRTTVVTPVVAASIGDPLVHPPRNVLLYGPPRCGARFIAERLVGELEDLVGRNVVVLDGIEHHESPGALAQVLNDASRAGDLVIATTHSPWELSATLIDAFDRLCFVHPPDWDARRFRLWESPLGRSIDPTMLDDFVIATEGWCGQDLAAVTESVVQDGGQCSVTDVWLGEAKAWAQRITPEGGLDDLVSYLQRVRRW